MQVNAPSHAAKNTIEACYGHKRRKNRGVVNTIKSIKTLLSILKMKLFEGRWQFTSKQQLWEAILASTMEIQAELYMELQV